MPSTKKIRLTSQSTLETNNDIQIQAFPLSSFCNVAIFCQVYVFNVGRTRRVKEFSGYRLKYPPF